MPPLPDKHYFLELGRHILLIARVGGERLEAIREVGIDNRLAVEEALSAIKPDWQTEGMRAVVSLSPLPTGWYLGSPEESKKSRTEAQLRSVLAGVNHGLVGDLELTGCCADDGAMIQPNGQARWLLAFAPKESFDAQTNLLAEWKIEADRIESAGLSRIGAIAAALKESDGNPVVLWDLAAEHSHVFLISKNGIEGIADCSVTLDEVFTATQAALGLKFKGAAARLFFNDTYDFSQTSSKIAAALAPGLKNALAVLPQGGPPPSLVCMGLTGRQSWFVRAVASAVRLATWNDDPRRLCSTWQVAVDPQLPEASPSLASIGLIHVISAYARRLPAWHPTWKKTNSTLPPMRAATTVPFAAVPAAAAPAAESPASRPPVAPVAEPRATPRAKPTLAPEPATAATTAPTPPPAPPPTAAPVAPPPPVPVAAPKPEAKPPGPAIVPTAAPLPVQPAGTQPPFPGLAVPKSLPPKPAPPTTGSPFPQHTTKAEPAVPVPAPRPRVPGEAVPAGRPAAPAPAPESAPSAAAKLRTAPRQTLPKARTALYLGVGAAAVALVICVFAFLYVKANREKAEALQREKAESDARAESERRAAEELARVQHDAEEAKRKTDRELEAAVATARQQAADQERQKILAQLEQERIEKLPGTLAVTTLPAGAAVSVDGHDPVAAPATIRNLAPGPHALHLELENYDSMDLKVQIKGGRTTDLGALPLQSIAGTIEVKSNPVGVAFTVRPAADAGGPSVFSGVTPAVSPPVLPGDYLVAFKREGWADHEEKVSVARRAKAVVIGGYDSVTVQLMSRPSGATVKQDGHVLGTTPLTLNDVAPTQSLSYDLTLVGFDPVRLDHLTTSGSTLHLTAEMLSSDRIAKPTEIKQAPHAYETPDPNLTTDERLRGAEVVISVVVLKNGNISDVEVEKTTDRWIGERCAEAVKDWKFNPAMGFSGQPLNVKIKIPFTIGRAGQ